MDSEMTINSGAGFEREPANLNVGVEIKDLVKVCYIFLSLQASAL